MQREGEGVRRDVVGRAVVVGIQGVTDGDIILAEGYVSAVGDRSRRIGREVGFLDGDVLQRHASAGEEGDIQVVAVELVDEVGLVDIQVISLGEGGHDDLLGTPVGDLIAALDVDGVVFVRAAELGHVEDEVVPVVAFKLVGRKHHLVVELFLGIARDGAGASGEFPGKDQFEVGLFRAAVGPGLGIGVEGGAGKGGFIAGLAGDGGVVQVGLVVEERIGGGGRPAEVNALRTVAKIDADVVAVRQGLPGLGDITDRPFYGVGDVEVHRHLRGQSLEGDVGRSHQGGSAGGMDGDVGRAGHHEGEVLVFGRGAADRGEGPDRRFVEQEGAQLGLCAFLGIYVAGAVNTEVALRPRIVDDREYGVGRFVEEGGLDIERKVGICVRRDAPFVAIGIEVRAEEEIVDCPDAVLVAYPVPGRLGDELVAVNRDAKTFALCLNVFRSDALAGRQGHKRADAADEYLLAHIATCWGL